MNYALAGLVCDYIAVTRGEDRLWGLVRAFRSPTGTVEDVVATELGLSTRRLTDQAVRWAAEGAAQAIVSTQS